MTMIFLKIILILSALLNNSFLENSSDSEFTNYNQKGKKMGPDQTQHTLNKSDEKYFLELKSNAIRINSGEVIKLFFLPKNKFDEKKLVQLETIHEKKIHLIIVSDDLGYFEHIHPTQNNSGEYSVETVFPFGGNYKLFAEYKPVGNNKITDKFDLFVNGDEKPKSIYKKEKLNYKDNSFYLTLKNADNIIAGNETHIPVEIFKDGKELNAANFDNYLGEKAHAVLIGIANFDFLHVHPMVMNNKLNLHMNIVESGYYRLWLQFQIDGKLYTADFVLYAKPSNQINEKLNHNQHKH